MVNLKFKMSSKGSITDIRAMKDMLKNLKKDFNIFYTESLTEVLKSSSTLEFYYGRVIQMLTQMQGEYFEGNDLVKEEDQTQLTADRWGSAVKAEIAKNLGKMSTSVEVGELNLMILSDEFLGVGSADNSPAPITWLYHFFVGNIDNNLIWVNKDIYEAVKGKEAPNLGRFGNGYMWHLFPGEEEKLNAQLQSIGLSVDKLRHPQSGKGPATQYLNLINSEDDFYSIVALPAADLATQKLKNKYGLK